MMIFLSLHTRNVNPLLQKYEPMKKSIFMVGCKNFDNQRVIKQTNCNDVKG